MKILFLVYSTTDSCSFYRSGGIAPDLARKLDITIDVKQWDEIVLHWQVIINYDMVMMQRPFSSMAFNFCQYLKNFHIPIWVDYDDYLLGVPAENKHSKIYNAEARENVKAILQMADIVTVPTEELKRLYLDYNRNIEVIPNAFNDVIFRRRYLKREPQRLIVWRGSDSHIYDVMTRGDEINAITEEAPEWQFMFVGFNPWYLTVRDNLFHLSEMDVIVYFKNLQAMAPAMLHVPLYDSPFNRAKSNIAYIEAAYFGAVCLAPDWEEWKRPGVLHYTDGPSYLEHMRALVRNEIDVKVESNRAWEYVHDTLFLSRVNGERMKLIKSYL